MTDIFILYLCGIADALGETARFGNAQWFGS